MPGNSDKCKQRRPVSPPATFPPPTLSVVSPGRLGALSEGRAVARLSTRATQVVQPPRILIDGLHELGLGQLLGRHRWVGNSLMALRWPQPVWAQNVPTRALDAGLARRRLGSKVAQALRPLLAPTGSTSSTANIQKHAASTGESICCAPRPLWPTCALVPSIERQDGHRHAPHGAPGDRKRETIRPSTSDRKRRQGPSDRKRRQRLRIKPTVCNPLHRLHRVPPEVASPPKGVLPWLAPEEASGATGGGCAAPPQQWHPAVCRDSCTTCT